MWRWKTNDERGGKDVTSVEESEIRSITSIDSVNDNDDPVSGFDASTCSGEIFYNIFDNKE